MSARAGLKSCVYCGLKYRPDEPDNNWCGMCRGEGLRAQPPDVQQYVRHLDAEWDQAEAEYLGQV